MGQKDNDHFTKALEGVRMTDEFIATQLRMMARFEGEYSPLAPFKGSGFANIWNAAADIIEAHIERT